MQVFSLLEIRSDTELPLLHEDCVLTEELPHEHPDLAPQFPDHG
jgi:hypothetical protein